MRFLASALLAISVLLVGGEVVIVLRGRYRPSTLYAAHLCPELSRVIAEGPNAGTLESLHPGELHRLWLRPMRDALRRQVVDRYGDPSIPRFETLRADIERVPT